MGKEPARFVVIGPGAIGGATAALLCRAGFDVTLVCRGEEVASRIAAEGIRVRGAKGDFSARPSMAAGIDALSGSFGYALIAVKAPDLDDAARRLLPFLTPDSLVVSMQNGICIDALSDVMGAERTVGCVVGWGATLLAPGEVDITSLGELVIGAARGDGHGRLDFLKGALDSVFPTVIAPDIFNRLYSKLIINSCITSVGALCGLTLGEMMGRRDARSLFISIIREAIAVADALGIEVPPYGGKLDYHRFLDGSGPFADVRRHVFLRLFGFAYRRLTSSSLQSLRRGRKTEIDYFNGYIAKRGREAAVPTPVNDRVTAAIKEIEEGARRIGSENLAEVLPLATGRRPG